MIAVVTGGEKKVTTARKSVTTYIIDRVERNLPLLPLIQSIKCLHVLRVQVEIVNIGIGFDALRLHTLREGDVSVKLASSFATEDPYWNIFDIPLLQAPPDQDLCRILVVLGTELFDDRIVKLLLIRADDGTVRLDDDALLLAVLDRLALLAPRVQLDLVDRGERFGQLLQDVGPADVSRPPANTSRSWKTDDKDGTHKLETPMSLIHPSFCAFANADQTLALLSPPPVDQCTSIKSM